MLDTVACTANTYYRMPSYYPTHTDIWDMSFEIFLKRSLASTSPLTEVWDSSERALFLQPSVKAHGAWNKRFKRGQFGVKAILVWVGDSTAILASQRTYASRAIERLHRKSLQERHDLFLHCIFSCSEGLLELGCLTCLMLHRCRLISSWNFDYIIFRYYTDAPLVGNFGG